MEHRLSAMEQGQTLVLVALMIVGLLAATGLAVDGGTLFLERRRMQSAADAAAMAGARDLVRYNIEDTVESWNDILETIRDYAQVNGVEEPWNNVFADHVYVDEDGVQPADLDSANAISVTVQIERPARFMRVVGIDVVPARAFSLAVIGAPAYGVTGLLPFGLPDVIWQDYPDGYPEGPITIHFGNCDEDECTLTYTAGGEEQSYAHRGWLNYNRINTHESEHACPNSGPGGPEHDKLRNWMLNGWWSGYLDVGDTVCSDQGVSATLFQNYTTEDMCIPIYEHDTFGEYNNRYIVVGFTGVRIIDANHSGNDKWIKIEIIPDHECPGGAGGQDFHAWTITQWE